MSYKSDSYQNGGGRHHRLGADVRGAEEERSGAGPWPTSGVPCRHPALPHGAMFDRAGRRVGVGGAAVRPGHLPCMPGKTAATERSRDTQTTLGILLQANDSSPANTFGTSRS